MRKSRVAAFTLMEVTIAMLLAALVIGMTYTIYKIVTVSYSSFNSKNAAMATIVRLDELLKKDFAKADLIEKTDNGILMINNQQTVNYEIEPGYIVRVAGIIDTFKVGITASTTTFEEKPVTETTPGEEQSRIDDLEMSLSFENATMPGHYHKQYSAANLINRTVHAVN